MPEYLSPGVYVEEIDTGSKPIEGVSTSTAGMIGVTERGPVDVPILITSFGEFTRWFGGYLNPRDFADADVQRPHRYLPHSVEGFFTNGGKRLYVVRVIDTAAADFAKMKLFDRDATASASTRLLTGIGTSPATDTAYVIDQSGLDPTVPPDPPTWVQIGDGSTAEFRTLLTPTGVDNDVALQLPLAFSYDNAGPPPDQVHVDRIIIVPASSSTQMLEPVQSGALSLRIGPQTGIHSGTIIRLGSDSPGGDGEYVIADADPTEGPQSEFTVVLRTPVQLPHAGTTVDILNASLSLPVDPNQAGLSDRTTLSAFTPQVSSGRSTLFLEDPSTYSVGQFLLISDGAHAEIRKIGQLGSMTLAVPAYANYPAGAIVESVELIDAAGNDFELTVDAAAGASVLEVSNRVGLALDDVIRIGLTTDPEREFIVIRSLPNPQAAPNPGKVVLATPLCIAKSKPSQLHRQQTPTRTTPSPTALTLTTTRGDQTLIASDQTGYTAANTVRVLVGPKSNDAVYHSLTGVAALDAKPVTLDSVLDHPHVAGEVVVARTPLLDVRALDQGRWGNRLRVAVRDSDPPLTRSRIRGQIQDDTHLRLESTNGIEPGSILLRVDGADNVLSTHKVVDINRQADFLITLEASKPLPFGAAEGDAVRSQEFQIDVFLLRQPDDAIPTRGETVLDAEAFRYLSMDPRHSRYVEKVIGTTWNLGANEDLARPPLPLRLADRRSEGESKYVRVYDLGKDASGTGEPDATLQSIRLGPVILVDYLPDGRKRPARRRLTGGDDSIVPPLGTINDDTYLGDDSPEPLSRTGLHSLRNEEEISIVAIPGRTSPAIQAALIEHCELMRYRFAVLDAQQPPKDSLNDVQTQRQQFDTKYAALYHPWPLIPDPYPANLAAIMDYPIPPSGHVMGIYARTDNERGVHKAPANEVLRGVIGLQRILNKGEQDILNPYPVNINVIRDFRPNNRGIRVWGGRVITSDPDWKYVNVRRLLIFIEASIDRGLQWVVFEPNSEPLWARVNRTVSNFLSSVWRDGGLEGTKPEEAYFVKVDRTTMTQTDIDNGRLIVVIGVAPVKPAEFVIIRIGLWTAHAET